MHSTNAECCSFSIKIYTDLHVASFTTGPQDYRIVRKYEKALMSANMVTLNNSEHPDTVSVTYNIEYVPAVM